MGGEVDASDAGEPSTVSRPLTCPSSSDMLDTHGGGGGGRDMKMTEHRIFLFHISSSVEPLPRTADLLGLLHGEREGLDWSELEAKELVLMLLSGLLREHTRSMDTLVFLHASHPHSALHLRRSEVRSAFLSRAH